MVEKEQTKKCKETKFSFLEKNIIVNKPDIPFFFCKLPIMNKAENLFTIENRHFYFISRS